MRVRSTLACMAAGLLVATGCQPSPAGFTEQDIATVRGMFDAAVRSSLAEDYATWAAQFSEDAFLQPPNAPTVKGREDIQAWREAFPALEELTFSNVQVWGEGNLAYGTSDYALKLKDGPRDSGKQLVVFRRAQGGQWQVVGGSFSSDLPVPGPETMSASPNQ